MRPGKLFWKFFLAIWLTQIGASFSVGMYFWWERQQHPPPEMMAPPPAEPPPGDLRDVHPLPPGGLHQPPPPSLRIPIPILISALVASFFSAFVLAHYLARPIRSLQQALDAAGEGELGQRPGAGLGSRQDELADLARAFDRMAERLRSVLEGQRRLLHDVSHELRSPLARIQAAVGLLRQQPQRPEENLHRIERETERMDALIGELLTLSRLEVGVESVMEEIELAELLLSVIDDVRFEWADKPVSVRVPTLPDVLAHGDGQLLHRAIENVLRNAVKFAPDNSTIEMDVVVQENCCYLAIRDEGPGVPSEMLDSIFEPFVRGPSGEKSVEGYGLGLAIARRVLTRMGGGIAAENRATGGLLVSLHLPVTRRPIER